MDGIKAANCNKYRAKALTTHTTNAFRIQLGLPVLSSMLLTDAATLSDYRARWAGN
jgi:hypothetical protein